MARPAVVDAALPAVVRVLRRVRAVADHVASPGGIVAEHVADLADGEVVVATVVVADGVGVHECHERGVGRVSQRPPGIEEGEAAGRGPNLAGGGLRHRALGERDIGERDGRRRAVIAAVEKRRPHERRQVEHVDHGIMIEVTLAP